MSDATGAAAAYDSGSSAVETNQSTLDTRPSSRPGTSRCLAVAQAIVPAASSPFTTTHAAASCQVAVARPYPATASVAIAQVPYMKRDEPARDAGPADREAATIAPRPPEVSTRPSAAALPPSSVFTTYGSSTSVGPTKSR